MKQDLNRSINNISAGIQAPETAYEQIFNLYRDEDIYYAFNISKTVNIPRDIDDSYIFYTRVTGTKTWTQLSHDLYGTIRLWWLICLTNKIMNPVINPEPGKILKVIKPELVSEVLESIKNQV